jgi:hypothetical protein
MNRRSFVLDLWQSFVAVVTFNSTIAVLPPRSGDPSGAESSKDDTIRKLSAELQLLKTKYDVLAGRVPDGFKRVHRAVREGLSCDGLSTFTVYEQLE